MPEEQIKTPEEQKPPVEEKPGEAVEQKEEQSTPKEFDSEGFQQKLETSLTEKIATNIASLKDELARGLGLSKEEKKEIPSDPDELKKYVQDQVNSGIKTYEESQKYKQEATTKEREKQVESIISNWDSEYESLVRQGKAPEIKKRGDMNDPGWRARNGLIKTVGEITKREKESGLPNRIPSIYEAYTTNPRAAKGVPGADLPISGNTYNAPTTEFDYQKDIRGASIQSIIDQAS